MRCMGLNPTIDVCNSASGCSGDPKKDSKCLCPEQTLGVHNMSAKVGCLTFCLQTPERYSTFLISGMVGTDWSMVRRSEIS